MKLLCKFVIAAIIAFGFFPWTSSQAAAVTPAGQLQETWGQIVVILKSARFDSEPEIDAFRTKVMEVVTPRFDFAEMAERCLGTHWTERTAEEREQFVKIFATMLARSYIGGIRSYKESTVFYTREVNDATDAEIDTRIAAKGAQDLFVTYKMHLIEQDWKVYDVVIDQISLIGNYRAQFRRVLTQSSFENLIRIMKEK
jgi:phospholipid transport system substrate-binding protein